MRTPREAGSCSARAASEPFRALPAATVAAQPVASAHVPQWYRPAAEPPCRSASCSPPVRPAAASAEQCARCLLRLRQPTLRRWRNRAPPAAQRVAAPSGQRRLQAPAPRMIMPQTGPRPVYKAPPRPAPPAGSPPLQRRDHAAGTRTPRSRAADFPAPASGSADRPASAAASWRAPADASHAASARGCASAGRWSGSASSGTQPSRQPSGRSLAAARPALCSARRERRPDEGLRSAAAHGGVERAAADHAQHHHHRRHQRERSGREARHSRQRFDRASAGTRRLRHHQPDARRGIGHRDGALLRRRNQRHHLRRAGGERHGRRCGCGRRGMPRWEPCPGRRWSPSWATSITAKPRCSTPSA